MIYIYMGYVRASDVFPYSTKTMPPRKFTCPPKRQFQKERMVFPPSFLRGELLVLGRVVRSTFVNLLIFTCDILFLPQSWFSGQWVYLKGNYYWRYTYSSLNHDYARKGISYARKRKGMFSFIFCHIHL